MASEIVPKKSAIVFFGFAFLSSDISSKEYNNTATFLPTYFSGIGNK
ncbi:MAG: hypothetical protein LBE82_10120 [Chitinophagaceae bacterium]|nr:hypothetical protein [Chitinophagaceae bacterium]